MLPYHNNNFCLWHLKLLLSLYYFVKALCSSMHPPPNSLAPYYNIGFLMPPTPCAIYFLMNHDVAFLDNANCVLCHLIQYCLELNKIPWGNLNARLITLQDSNKSCSSNDGLEWP